MKYLLRLYYTLKPLKGRQWWYRLVQPSMKRCSRLCRVSPKDIATALAHTCMPLISLPVNKTYEPAKKEFCFLNLKAGFQQGIDWNYAAHGLLWTYNLNYFEWLYDDRLDTDERLQTMRIYADEKERIHIGLQCYPASLRIVAWTRFLLRYDVKDERIVTILYQHADWLCRFPEYHLDGNHLWENAVALVIAGLFFHNDRFYKKGKSLLTACLREQLFEDGGHVEGSPMYHSLLLWRLMQCIEIMRALSTDHEDLLQGLERAAEKMTDWLSAITFSDGTWPAINDCTNGIAPATGELYIYARQLQLNIKHQPLQDSQYRMFTAGPMELFVDAADIHPAYQPGHAHADVGTFCLHVYGRPLIVDTGISTYAEGALRSQQRSTAAHNTMCINERNTSDVWRSFRVGRRARITGFSEGAHELELHYECPHTTHKRTFSWAGEILFINDSFESRSICEAIVNLHFHPDETIKQLDDFTCIVGRVEIHFDYALHIRIMSYEWAKGFNESRKAQYISVTFSGGRLMTIVRPT